jgi:hypothetical protein
MMGLISVLIAYISGLLLVSRTGIALVLLCGAVLLGYLSTNPRLKRMMTPK